MRRLPPVPRGLSAWIVLGVILVVPLGVLVSLAALSGMKNPTASAGRVRALVVPVTHSDMRAQTTTDVEVVFAPGRDLVVRVSGTVTSAPRVGRLAAAGDVVLSVDDRPIRALVASAPLWRVLRPGSTGEDVRRLKTFLRGLGQYSGPMTSGFDSALARAVTAFNKSGGFADTSTFDPATVIWVGPKAMVVGEALVSAGTDVTVGTPVARGPRQARSIAVREPQGGIAAVGNFGTGAVVTIGKTSVPYQLGSGAITRAEQVAAVRKALLPATAGVVTVQARKATSVAVVPASALVSGDDGTTCVYASPDGPPTVVTPIGGGVESAQLPASFPLTSVVANPGELNMREPCGS